MPTPVAVHVPSEAERLRPCLMPAVLAVFRLSDAVLDVVFAGCTSLRPSRDGHITIVGMDRIEPTEAETLLERHSGEHDPLRAAPVALAGAARAEHELGNVGGQQTKELLAFAELLLRIPALGQIAQDLDEAAPVRKRHDGPRSPEARAILPYVPALVFRPPSGAALLTLFLRSHGSAVLRREHDVAVAADDLVGGVAQQSLGPNIPACDDALSV